MSQSFKSREPHKFRVNRLTILCETVEYQGSQTDINFTNRQQLQNFIPEEYFTNPATDPEPSSQRWHWLAVALVSVLGGAGTAWLAFHNDKLPLLAATEKAAIPMVEGIQVSSSQDLLRPQFAPPDYQRVIAEQQQTYPLNEEWFYTLATEWSPLFYGAQWSELSSWQQAFLAQDLYDRLTRGINPDALTRLGNQGRDYYTTLTFQMEALGLPKESTQKQADIQFFEIFPELQDINIKGYQALSAVWFSSLEDVIQSRSVQTTNELNLAPKDRESLIDFALP